MPDRRRPWKPIPSAGDTILVGKLEGRQSVWREKILVGYHIIFTKQTKLEIITSYNN